MLRLLRFLLTGDAHLHKWQTVKAGNIQTHGEVSGFYYFLRCEVCGEVRYKTV